VLFLCVWGERGTVKSETRKVAWVLFMKFFLRQSGHTVES
jgi:hypothetical protein